MQRQELLVFFPFGLFACFLIQSSDQWRNPERARKQVVRTEAVLQPEGHGTPHALIGRKLHMRTLEESDLTPEPGSRGGIGPLR